MSQSFGGPWTAEKLEAVRRYFDAYARALKNQPFEKLYIDAFAGSGERTDPRAPAEEPKNTLFGEDTGEIGEVKEG